MFFILSSVETQCVLRFLSNLERITVMATCRRVYTDGLAPFAWKHAEAVEARSLPAPAEVAMHSLLRLAPIKLRFDHLGQATHIAYVHRLASIHTECGAWPCSARGLEILEMPCAQHLVEWSMVSVWVAGFLCAPVAAILTTLPHVTSCRVNVFSVYVPNMTLAALPSLTCLRVHINQLDGPSDLCTLVHGTRLRDLSLSSYGSIDIPDTFWASMSNLRHLDLNAPYVLDSLARFRQVLAGLRELESLSLHLNAGEQLAQLDALSCVPTLRRVCLRWYHFDEVREDVLLVLAAVLAALPLVQMDITLVDVYFGVHELTAFDPRVTWCENETGY